MEYIDGVEILALDVVLYGEITNTDKIDLGAVYLSNKGRKYVLDVTRSTTTIDGGFSTIRCELEKDEDTFPVEEHLYDLTATDLGVNPEATFYIASDLPIEHITLFVRRGDCTIAIDVTQE